MALLVAPLSGASQPYTAIAITLVGPIPPLQPPHLPPSRLRHTRHRLPISQSTCRACSQTLARPNHQQHMPLSSHQGARAQSTWLDTSPNGMLLQSHFNLLTTTTTTITTRTQRKLSNHVQLKILNIPGRTGNRPGTGQKTNSHKPKKPVPAAARPHTLPKNPLLTSNLSPRRGELAAHASPPPTHTRAYCASQATSKGTCTSEQ